MWLWQRGNTLQLRSRTMAEKGDQTQEGGQYGTFSGRPEFTQATTTVFLLLSTLRLRWRNGLALWAWQASWRCI